MDLPSPPLHSTVARFSFIPCRPAALATAVWLAACDDPQPPFACDTIPQQTLHVGVSKTVEPCFEDPNEDKITLAAESSDSTVASAAVQGEGIAIRGVSPGTAKVTTMSRVDLNGFV